MFVSIIFFFTLVTIVPKTIHEVLDHPDWQQTKIDEMQALTNNGMWELVPLPFGKKTFGCRSLHAITIGPSGDIDHLKARLLAKGYMQMCGPDY